MGTIASSYSTPSEVTVTTDEWRLDDPLELVAGMVVNVAPGFAPILDEPQTEHHPAAPGALPVVVTAGVRGWRGQVAVRASTNSTRSSLLALVRAARPLLLRSVLGDSWYVKLGAQSTWTLVKAEPKNGDVGPIRDLHDVIIPWVEVRTP